MATVESVGEARRPASRSDRFGAWIRRRVSGTKLDWGFVALSAALVGTGYYDAWINRNPPLPDWEHVPIQVSWLAITLYLGGVSILAWRRDRQLESAVPEGYGMAVAGIVIFGAGIVLTTWWTDAFGQDFGVPAIFRLPNLMQIAGAALIVSGPLRASAARGELMAGPMAVMSTVLLLAVITFFWQFDHPYIDEYAAKGAVLLPDPRSTFDLLNNREEILGVLGLLVQSAVVTGLILWTLRQARLPVGSVTLMLTATAFLTATQLGHFSMVPVAFVIGVLCEIVLLLVRPRSDRVLGMRIFAVAAGALLSGVYLAYIGIVTPGTWWPIDMTVGSVIACAMVGGLMSYVLFPGANATRAASVLWPALTQEESSAEAPDVTVERVEHALKVLHSTRDLAESPLVGMRSVAGPTPVELRKTIESAIEHLSASAFQQDAQAGQILDLYYVRRIGGHYAVHIRVGLSRAAYFNRRSYGVRRLVDRLREQEESAKPA